VDPGASLLAVERAPLRRAPGVEQGRNGGEIRRQAGAGLAAQLRHPAPGPGARGPPRLAGGSPLLRDRPIRVSAHGMSQGHRRSVSSLLERHHRAGGPRGAQGPHRRSRQQPARPGEISGRGERLQDRRSQHSDWAPAGLRARRRLAAAAALLPGRRGRGRSARARRRRPGQGRKVTPLRCIGLGLVLVPVLALAQGEAEKLEALRSRLEGLRAKVAESEESRTEVRDQLRDSERAISEANRSLRALAARRAAAEDELKTLAKRSQALEAEIASRREALGRLLALRYINGEQSGVKLLFSGDEPGRIARELHYYSYVSRA